MEKRSAPARIRRIAGHACMTKCLLLSLCFVVAVSWLAVSAQAYSGNDSFADVYGLEFADGDKAEVEFRFPGYGTSLFVRKGDTVESVVSRVNEAVNFWGYALTYDEGTGQLIGTENNSRVNLSIFVDGKELVMKSASGMSVLLDALETIAGLISSVWMLMTSNPLMIAFLTVGLFIIAVRVFRYLQLAARKG